MRALGLSAKIGAVCGLGAAMLLVMGLPWFGSSPQTVREDGSLAAPGGSLEDLADAIPRWFASFDDGRTAWEALDGRLADVLAALVVVTVISALLCLVGALKLAARALAPLAALGVLGIVGTVFVNPPGENLASEPRYGLFTAVVCAFLLLSSSFGLRQAALRSRRRPAPRPAAKTPTAVYDSLRSTPPPR